MKRATARSWTSYRLWYVASIALFLAYAPYMLLVVRAAPAFVRERGILLPFLAYAAVWILAQTVVRRWPCPRCGKHFFGTPVFNVVPLFLIGACRNCGLRKYEPPAAHPVKR